MQTYELRKLSKELSKAASYIEWREIANKIERHSGIERWKSTERSPHYDFREIRLRLDKLRALRNADDRQGLLFTLNEGVHGNIGGMGRSRLYNRPLYGTKQLITDYINEVSDALVYLSAKNIEGVNRKQKREFFQRVSHCFGSSALMMSGGGMLLYFHVGMARCLLENDLLPNVISGSSGGAYVAAILGTHTDSELLELLSAEAIANRIRSLGHIDGIRRRSRGGALTAEELVELVRKLVPDMTFAEAHEHTGRYINIPVAPVESHQTPHLLNAMTTPNVYIHEAVRASGAMPGLYEPVGLAAQDNKGKRKTYMPSRKWVDGSISDDLPAKRLARLYGVNHYIVSQINPHLLPFINESQREHDPGSIIRNATIKSTRAWINAAAVLLQRGISHNQALNTSTNHLLSIVNQDYVGDINILPPFRFRPPIRVLAHPNLSEMQGLIDMGQRATWPKLEMIALQTRISRTLRDLVEQ